MGKNSLNKAKILVIEDEVTISNLLKKVIELDDFSVDTALDGKSGLNKAKNGEYDLIVLDIMLPELNGLEVCKELRSKNIMTPIIMLTAKDTIEDRLVAKDAGANDYISKPFSFVDLLDRIHVLLTKENSAREKISGKDKIIFSGEDRRKTDSKLAEFNKRIMDNIPVSIITIDKEGNITSANKYYHNFSNTKEFWKTNIFTNKFFIRENLVGDYKKLLSDGTVLRKDYCFERNINGEDKYLKIVAVPLLDKDGNIEGALSMAQDNTESVSYKKKLQLLNNELEKKVEQRTKQLNQANVKLAKVLDLKSMFIADVSHEMRTSLAIIQGNIELISRGVVEECDKNESNVQIFDEIKRMVTMLSDMSFLSDSDPKQGLDLEIFDINKLISSVCKTIKVVANEKKISIEHKKPKVKIRIRADLGQITKLLSNLIRNSIRYNKKNGLVEIWVEKTKTGIMINVQDTGIGIPEENLPYIFERFYRVDKARSRNDGGSGLGLAICKWVAEVHGGSIKAISELGIGSLFTVSLPSDFEKASTRQ